MPFLKKRTYRVSNTKQRRHFLAALQSLRIPKFFILFLLTLFTAFILISVNALPFHLPALQSKTSDTIKWVDFDVPYEALDKAMHLDIDTYESELHLNWIDLLAYLGAKYGGNFNHYEPGDMDALVEKLRSGKTMKSLTKNMKYFNYYKRAYTAVLGGFLGEFKVEVPTDDRGENSCNTENDNSSDQAANKEQVTWEKRYGLKAFSPIAQGYWYDDYDDFGNGRSYGYQRKHFGHDLMISTGTPIIAVESGIVEATGWNQYGGWRIGIRSFDKQRYYYYAHLRKDHPYSANLYVGKTVKAGDVIGYSGQTGYSIKENVNNIDTPHLHFGMQLIFDEKEKDSPNQIWIDLYSITRLLSSHKSPVYKEEASKEYYRKYDFSEPNFYAQKEKKASAKTNSEGIPLPIIMYHGLIKDPKLQNKFFISPDIFEEDLKYLKEKGYTTIFMKDLIDYVEKGKKLPEKPIILSFDDGYYNNYLYGFPLLKKYNMKALISIIGKYTDQFSEVVENNASYSHITWDQINEMERSGHIEIGNHTYDMHTYNQGRKGTKQKPQESDEQYRQILLDDIGKLQNRIKEKTGKEPETFAYPFGFISGNSKDILKEMGIKATLSCTEGVNTITRDPDCLFQLKRYLRPPNKSSSSFFKNIAE